MSIAKGNITDWVEKYTDELVSWAYYKTKQQALAEDIVQDTFIAAYNNIGKFQSKSSPKTWLFSILKNKIADHFRNKLQQSMVHESDMQSESSSNILDRLFDNTGSWVTASRPSSWDTPEEELLDNQEFNKVLKACMDLLNEKSYLSLQYKYLEGKEGRVICQELGITPSNFWQILHRAKLQLRECIDQNWFN
jgi:RNA polymerase sigma-70 factor (TIGR02943 family)